MQQIVAIMQQPIYLIHIALTRTCYIFRPFSNIYTPFFTFDITTNQIKSLKYINHEKGKWHDHLYAYISFSYRTQIISHQVYKLLYLRYLRQVGNISNIKPAAKLLYLFSTFCQGCYITFKLFALVRVCSRLDKSYITLPGLD